jgi:hypothetical protein
MTTFRDRLMFVVVLCASAASIRAAEYQQLEDIAAESAEEASVGLQDIDKAPEKRPRRQLLRDALADAPPFWRDSSLDFGVRVYDFERENGVQSIAEAFAAGTELTFRSGKWRDRLSTVVSWHTSFAIDAPEGLGRTGLLAPDQSDLSVISRAYLQYELGETTSLRLYRQDFNMPYINRKDSRMIPNTHEAYVLRYPGERLQWLFGQVTKMKERDSEDFVPMGEIAGVEGDNAGTTVAGARYKIGDDTNLGTLVQHTNDLFTTAYTEASFRRTISEDWGLQIATQLTNQWSVGEELLGDFSTYTWGLRGKVSFRGGILTTAYTNTGDFRIRKPFGGTPGFTSSMLFDFDRAHEDAYRIGLSQNFAKYGLPGASLIVNYTKGRSAQADDGTLQPDADVISITADFRPQKGFLKGLWLRVRYADGDRGSPAADRREVRVILNYSLGALQ